MKKQLSALLAALMLAASLTACASDGDTPAETDGETTPAVTTEETTTQPPETEYELAVKTANYENADWHLITLKRTAAGGMYQYIDVAWQEELEGDVYNDALHARNMKVEEDFKVVLKVTENDGAKATLTSLVAAGDTTYSAIATKMEPTLAMGQEGVVQDLAKLDALQLDAPWWDEALFRDLSLGSKMFMITGDVSVMDEEMLYLIFCNKKLLKDNNLGDPYELVRQNKWTLDKLYELCQGLAKDLDGNGVFDEKDMYGFGNDYGTAALMLYAAGGNIATLDKDGAPQLVLMNEKNQQIIEWLATFYNDTTTVVNATKIPGTWGTLKTMRLEERLVFWQGNIYNIPANREMISDFGLLPMPKWSPEQEEYRHVVATDYATGLAIPASLGGKDLERACVILTALSAYSEEAVNAYYEVNLKYKNSRDAESQDMLEIIFNSKCYDLGKTFNWAKLQTVAVRDAIKEPGTFASKYEANKSAAEAAMAKSYEFFK